MNIVALSVVIVTAIAALGAAAWIWRTLATVGDELNDFAGFDAIRFEEDRRAPNGS